MSATRERSWRCSGRSENEAGPARGRGQSLHLDRYPLRYHNAFVSKRTKLLLAVRNNPTSVRFSDLVRLLEALGFEQRRVVGSHRVFVHPRADVPLVNVQEGSSGTAKG